ncbi:MAG: BREX system serine/threonine kinase PglW, partial [Dactylosporangium sp.]|nr:BREX system serine/threonine kinase PglW [Dactylosporangium sp.]
MAYHVEAGRPPATDAPDLRDRLTRDGGLDLVADVPEVPAKLRQLVLQATRPAVAQRLADVPAFLALLDDVERETSFGEFDDPLEAPAGTLLGQRFELLSVLGSGSTARALLVADRAAGGERRVLKVALDDAAAARLRGEAEVLAALRKLNHPRVVRLIEPEPLMIGNRTALLLDHAGDSTLAQVLRERSRLSLDLLERYGTDLLEAVVALDKANVDHRDIKPANLGVREQRSDRAKHLVLFDFSLSRAAAASVEAGTPPYLDPFLGVGTRQHWDSAAERYAAAVTLFEMATGQTPTYGDGVSDPAVIDDEATVEPGLFDPSVAASLVDFFRRALR